jgi:dinuclear metal center YbgI/SA1388 family protein
MKVRDLAAAMDAVAPLVLAEDWDNVGLLAGSAEWGLKGPVVLTIDLTERVLAEAVKAGASAVVAYHPPIWEGMKRVTDDDPRGRVVLGALRAGIAVYSPHTALDAAAGGVTDWLCEGLDGDGGGGADRRALRAHSKLARTQEVKIVTFVPMGDVERVRSALASAGAGIIGNYTVCSFAAAGRGTFLAGSGANPAVGESGKLEEVGEMRLEMVCSKLALPLALEVLRRFHPYEEPAVDVYELLCKPDRYVGAGRRVTLDHPATLSELASRLKKHLAIEVVNIACAHEKDAAISRVGVCPGSGAALAGAARADGCEVFVTGEMKHHEVLEALNSGMSVILAGHTNTERGYLPRLAERLRGLLKGVEVRVSSCDRSPRVPV